MKVFKSLLNAILILLTPIWIGPIIWWVYFVADDSADYRKGRAFLWKRI